MPPRDRWRTGSYVSVPSWSRVCKSTYLLLVYYFGLLCASFFPFRFRCQRRVVSPRLFLLSRAYFAVPCPIGFAVATRTLVLRLCFICICIISDTYVLVGWSNFCFCLRYVLYTSVRFCFSIFVYHSVPNHRHRFNWVLMCKMCLFFGTEWCDFSGVYFLPLGLVVFLS